MQMPNVFSARNVTLFVFILVVLFLGATFNVRLGPESFVDLNELPNLVKMPVDTKNVPKKV
jgi:hypothetical protein